MQSQVLTRFQQPVTRLSALAALLLLLPSCDRADSDNGDRPVTGRGAAFETQPVMPNPCGVIPAAEVEQLLGPMPAPGRAFSAERPEPADDGRACLYRFADQRLGNIAVQVDMVDATTFEVGSAMAIDAMRRNLGPGAMGENAEPATEVPERESAAGWDYVGGLPSRMFVGRLGHMAVQIGYRSVAAPSEKIAELAARVRDRIPDRPVAAEGAHPNAAGTGNDPCGLVIRSEAEAVLGALPVAPYRSRESTPLADGEGPSCSYYRGKHRVLVLTPTWSDGAMSFGMAAGLSQRVASTIGGGQTADTLEGPWDQAGSGVHGALYFLKSDRMLEVRYREASIDAAAVRLATAAMRRF
jgi:hypothetical protein